MSKIFLFVLLASFALIQSQNVTTDAEITTNAVEITTNAAPITTGVAAEVTTGVAAQVTTGNGQQITTGVAAAATTSQLNNNGFYARFVNALDGKNITIETTFSSPITLPYQGVSGYVTMPNGQLTVSRVVDSQGVVYTSVPYLVQAQGFATVAAIFVNNVFNLILFNESNSQILFSNNQNAFIRLIDLSPTPRYLSIDAVSTTIFSYVGFLESTPFIALNPVPVTSIRAYETLTSNVYPFAFGSGLTVNGVYTIFFFGSNDTRNGILNYDRAVGAIATTRGANTPVTTGRAVGTTGSQTISTTSRASTTRTVTTGFNTARATTGSVNPDNTSASAKLQVAIATLALAALLF